MEGKPEPSIQASGAPTSTTTVAKSLYSSRFLEQPGTSVYCIRLPTPPPFCAGSPDSSYSPRVSGRVLTRPETPSALAILAAVCSSPSVRWDGVKHRYGEGHGKSIWCEDLRTAHDASHPSQIVDLSIPRSPHAYGERPITFQDTAKRDLEGYGICDMRKTPTTEEIDCSDADIGEGEDTRAANFHAEQDYLSELPSSPPTLVFSSPCNRTCDDFSSSEHSSMLPSSFPLPSQHKALFTTSTEPACDVNPIHFIISVPHRPTKENTNSRDTSRFTPLAPDKRQDATTPSVEQPESKFYDAEGPTTDCEPTCTPFLSPLQAPESLPESCMDLTLSPLSSLVSSPLSDLVDEHLLPSTASKVSPINDPMSVRSASPEMCATFPMKPKTTGRRASTNAIEPKARRMSGLSSFEHWQRSDTGLPDVTSSKRSRQPSPSSTVCRPLQVRPLFISPSRSPRSNRPIISSTTLEENQPVLKKKQKQRVKQTNASVSSKVKRSTESCVYTTDAHTSKRRKGKSSNRRAEVQLCTDAPVPELNVLSCTQLAALPVTGFLVETLALSRASAMTAPELLRSVLKSQPHLMEERAEKSWLEFVRYVLKKVRMFGRIERRGTDAADRPLEDQWFYIPENDKEHGRAELLRGLMPKKRDVTMRSKQYYFEPVSKVSRWDPEDD